MHDGGYSRGNSGANTSTFIVSGCMRTSTVGTSSDAYLHRYFIRGVTGAVSHSVRIKIEHLSFQVRLNEHINNLESPSNVRGEAFVQRRQTWVRSLMKETMCCYI